MRPLILLVLAAPFLTGCVAWEIRDEMRIATYQLEDVKCSLEKVQAQLREVKSTVDTANAGLDRADERLTQSNKTLANVDADLDRLDRTNESLVATNETLVTMKGSIARVDEHLGSLRRTISRLDNAIPFFDFGDESPVESAPAQASAAAPEAPAAADAPIAPQPAEGAAPTQASAPAGASTPSAPTTTEQTPARRDPLIGTWISQFPKEQDVAIILLADSKGFYVMGGPSGGGGAKIPAAWKRDGQTLTLELSSSPDSRTGQPANNNTITFTYTIIAQTQRTLTVESTNGVMVLAKP